MELCEQATKEHDPDKLLKLVEELDRLLEVRKAELRAERTRRPSPFVP